VRRRNYPPGWARAMPRAGRKRPRKKTGQGSLLHCWGQSRPAFIVPQQAVFASGGGGAYNKAIK